MRWLFLLLAAAGCHERATSPAEKPSTELSATLDTSCAVDSDCVPEPDCCPTPCTESVINVRDEQRARAALDCSTTEKHGCPQAGSCRTFAYLCVERQCKLVFDGDPGFRARNPAL